MLRFTVLPLGLACCALEYHAAATDERLQDAWRSLAEPSGAGADGEWWEVLVLAGTMTHALTPTIEAAYRALGPRRAVVSFGACSTSGGPYWDSYSVATSPPVPVDVFIPGCPPTPAALLDGLSTLRDHLLNPHAESSGTSVPASAVP